MRHIALIFAFLCLLMPARAAVLTNLTYDFADFTGRPLNVKRVTITPLAYGADYEGAQLSARPIVFTPTLYPDMTNGTLNVTNLVAGYAYRVEFADSYTTTAITNYFPSTLTGAVDAGDYKGVILSQTGGVTFQFAYYQGSESSTNHGTMALTNGVTFMAHLTNIFSTHAQLNTASNLLWSEIEAAAGGGISAATATNIAAYQAYLATNGFVSGISVAAGDNVTLSTNGTVVTINAEAGGSSNAITNNNASAVTLADNLSIGGIFTLSDTPSNHIAAAGDTLVLTAGSGTSQIKIDDGPTGTTITGQLNADGYGITNIPLAGVTGLPTALDWLTNNGGGISQTTASAMMADGTNSFAGDGSGLTNLAAAKLMTNGIVYVSTNGVDAIGNGRFDSPFRSLTYALTNSTTGSTIQLGVGNFAESDLHVTNRNIVGTDRYASHLVYSNASFGLRLYGTNNIRNLTVRPSYTNASLTYVITPISGTLTVEDCELYGQSDVFFFYDAAATLNVTVRNNNILTPWDAWNGNSAYGSKYVIQNNIWTFYDDAGLTQAKQWLRNINGQEALVTGNRVRMTGGTPDNVAITGSDLSRLYLFGNDIESEDVAINMSDTADLYYPYVVGRLSGTHSNKFRQFPVRTSELRLFSPWQNDAAIVATNTTVAYRGDTKGVGSAGTTAVNGLYVLQYDNHLHDVNWSLSEAVWTNTANPRLKLIRADTNEINYLYAYQIFTNGNASATAPSTSWTLLYSTLGWADAWSADGGAGPAPTVTNYAPTLKILVSNGAEFSAGLSVAGTKISLNADGGASFASGASSFDTLGSLSLGGGNLGLYSTGDIEGPGLAYTITAAGDATFASVAGSGSGITSLPIAGIAATGTPSGTTYLRGDGAWATPSGGTTYTNNSGYAGQVVGSGIGTNVYASLTNKFTGTGAIVLSNSPTLYNAALTGSNYMENLTVGDFYPELTNTVVMAGADGATTNLTIGSGLSLTGTTLSATGGDFYGPVHTNSMSIPATFTANGVTTTISSNSITTGNSTNTGNFSTASLTMSGGGTVVGTFSLQYNSTLILGGPIRLQGTASVTLAASTNDYAFNATANTIRITNSSGANVNITGLATQKNYGLVLLVNITPNQTITLKNEDAGSTTAGNRFALSADYVIAANESVFVWYDNTTARWRVIR